MADVQVENGYTRIADDLLEALSRSSISGRHFRVMLALIRLTYGYRKTERALGSKLIGIVSGLNDRRVRDVLVELQAKGMIERKQEPGRTATIRVVKDFEKWVGVEGGRPNGGPATRGAGLGEITPDPRTADGSDTRGSDRSDTRVSASTENFTENSSTEKPAADAPPLRLDGSAPKEPTPTERARVIWPRLVEAAARHGKDWKTLSASRVKTIAARIRDDKLDGDDLVRVIDGAVVFWGKGSETFDPHSALTPETVFAASNWPKYIEAADQAQPDDPKRPLTATDLEAMVEAHNQAEGAA